MIVIYLLLLLLLFFITATISILVLNSIRISIIIIVVSAVFKLIVSVALVVYLHYVDSLHFYQCLIFTAVDIC